VGLGFGLFGGGLGFGLGFGQVWGGFGVRFGFKGAKRAKWMPNVTLDPGP
jgi:hypothetical protein